MAEAREAGGERSGEGRGEAPPPSGRAPPQPPRSAGGWQGWGRTCLAGKGLSLLRDRRRRRRRRRR